MKGYDKMARGGFPGGMGGMNMNQMMKQAKMLNVLEKYGIIYTNHSVSDLRTIYYFNDRL